MTHEDICGREGAVSAPVREIESRILADFETLKALALRDPVAYFELRSRLVTRYLARAAPASAGLRQFQDGLDILRHAGGTPTQAIGSLAAVAKDRALILRAAIACLEKELLALAGKGQSSTAAYPATSGLADTRIPSSSA